MKLSSYKKNKTYILKYQKENPNYRIYKRKYETGYRNEHKVEITFSSWKNRQRKAGKNVTIQKEMNYLLSRFLGETCHVK